MRPTQRKPNGPTIGPSLNVPPAKHYDPVRHAIGLVDRVHGDGTLEPLNIFSIRMNRGDQGGYAFENDQPIGIVFNSRGRITPATALEEIGHMLDHQVLGGTGDRWASQDPNSDVREVINAIQESPTVQRVAGYRIGQRVSLRQALEVVRAPMFVDQEILEYEQSVTEWFARAYTQFIGLSTGDPQVLGEIAGLISTPGYEILYPRAWPEGEFGPIAKAFERVFRAKGWVR